jgi:hypothetical protein
MDITKIYLVENCYGDPNKIYIGKTKINNNRENEHRLKFGKEIIFTYIDEVDSLNKEKWKPLECFWIEYFRQLEFNIQNKNKGGNGRDFMSEETKLKISKSNKGKICKEETKEKISKSSIGKTKSLEYKLKLSNSRKGIPTKKATPTLQYDLEGNFIKEWAKIDEILKFFNKPRNNSNITSCCKGKTKTAYNYIWKYK